MEGTYFVMDTHGWATEFFFLFLVNISVSIKQTVNIRFTVFVNLQSILCDFKL